MHREAVVPNAQTGLSTGATDSSMSQASDRASTALRTWAWDLAVDSSTYHAGPAPARGFTTSSPSGRSSSRQAGVPSPAGAWPGLGRMTSPNRSSAAAGATAVGTGAAAVGTGAAAAGRAAEPSTPAARARDSATPAASASRRAASSPVGSVSIRLSRSQAFRAASITSLLMLARPSRAWLNTSSTWWAKRDIAPNPAVPPDPLIVCMARNTRLIASTSFGSASRASRALSSSSNRSTASSRNVALNSSARFSKT